MMSKKERTQDLNYIIIKDNHGKKYLRKIIFSRVVLNFLLIILQIVIFLFFVFKAESKLEYYFGPSILLSTLFMVYLSNCKGRNEFKIAWLVPVVIFPLFGVSAYLMYHLNQGGIRVRRRIKYLKEKTEAVLPPEEQSLPVLQQFPDVKDLGHYLATHGKFPPHAQTQVTYFPNGEEFFPAFLESLNSAQKFIFIEFFIISVDEAWAQVLSILEQKAAQGVEVRLLYDGFGSPMAASRSYLRYLEKKGIHSQIFIPLRPFFSTQQNNRDHRKIVVIDGKTGFTGGLNVSNEYFNQKHTRFDYWKDNAVKIEGSAVQNLALMFLQTWNIGTRGDDDYAAYMTASPSPHDVPGLVIPYGDDAYNQEDIAEDVYLYIINNAKKYVHITTPYMVIDNQLQDALIFAARRGIDVSVIVPSAPDHFLTFCIGKTFLRTLVANGIHVYLYERGFIHAKTFVSDDVIATVGSVNMDYRSFFHHFECGALMYKSPVVADIEADFEATLADCTPMALADYKKIPSRYRVLGRVFRIFAPLI